MNIQEIDWRKTETMIRREAQKRFGREYGRFGVSMIVQFALDMLRAADRKDAPAKPAGGEQGELGT